MRSSSPSTATPTSTRPTVPMPCQRHRTAALRRTGQRARGGYVVLYRYVVSHNVPSPYEVVKLLYKGQRVTQVCHLRRANGRPERHDLVGRVCNALTQHTYTNQQNISTFAHGQLDTAIRGGVSSADQETRMSPSHVIAKLPTRGEESLHVTCGAYVGQTQVRSVGSGIHVSSLAPVVGKHGYRRGGFCVISPVSPTD